MRFVQLRVDPSKAVDLEKFYQQRTLVELQKMEGCLFAGLIHSGSQNSEFISLTLWKTHQQADNYEASGVYKKLIDQTMPYLAESSEWKMQLSDKMELEYKPVEEVPVLKEYNVSTDTDSVPEIVEKEDPIFVRIVSVKIQESKMEEMEGIYNSEVIPALKATPGCKAAFLTKGIQDEHEAISLTIWESQKHAQDYERSGMYEKLVKKLEHTFSDLLQWKISLEKSKDREIKTSDDLTVSSYFLVTGKKF